MKKDGTAAWDDVQDFAAAIRAGQTKWEDIASDDMDIRVKVGEREGEGESEGEGDRG